MTKLKLTIEYVGTEFHGWQSHQGLCTVQGELERAFTVYFSAEAKKAGIGATESVAVVGSGRTDAGVHARRQVAHVVLPSWTTCSPDRIKAALNGICTRGLVVHDVSIAEPDFHARHSPHKKCYSYSITEGEPGLGIDRGFSWLVRRTLDVAAMVEAARLVEGQHDFRAFRAQDCTARTTERTVLQSQIVRVGDNEIRYLVVGKGFLKQMVRILTGTLVDVGLGRRTVGDFKEILESRDRTRAGATAPACGLTLEWVRYGGADAL